MGKVIPGGALLKVEKGHDSFSLRQKGSQPIYPLLFRKMLLLSMPLNHNVMEHTIRIKPYLSWYNNAD